MSNAKYAEILEQSSVPKKVWKTALYLRLSRDDGTESESNSIASQREILKEYIKRYPDMEIYDIYVDATVIIGLKQNPTHGRRFSPVFFA